MMVRTPDSSEDLFAEPATNWDLQKLYKDLAVAKGEFAPHQKRGLTHTEKKHLGGLLCGYSPAEMAKKLHKSARGVEADLCKTIYRYVEQLTKQPLNTLKNWRDIPKWLEQTGYKIQVFNAVDGEKAIASLVELKKALRQIAARNFKGGKSYFEEQDLINIISINNSVIYDLEVLSGLLIKSGGKSYKFCNIAVQEYLVAELCINLEEGWQDIIRNFFGNKPWQRVFTLVQESIHLAKNSEQLIVFISQNINRNFDGENKLNEFLCWVNKKAKSTQSNYHQALIRAFYLESHLHFENTIRVLNTEETIDDFDVSDYKLELCQAIDHNFNYELDNNLYVDYKLYTILRDILINDNIPTNNIDDIYMCYEMINETLTFNILTNVNKYSMLLRDVQQLKNQIPLMQENEHSILLFEAWYYNNSYKWDNQLKLVIFNHRDLGKCWEFDDREYCLLRQYYEGNKLFINYLNNVSNIDNLLYNRIKDNLFLPLDSSLS